MRTLCLLSFLFCFAMISRAQVGGVVVIANGKRYTASPTSTVSDTAGRIYPYAEWTKLFATGDYAIEATDSTGITDRFYIIRMTPAQRREYYSDSPKPRQTSYFDSGGMLPWFRAKDLEGVQVDTRKLDNKILVINFWFITCKPCVAEIPSLNKLADSFAGDTSIVFLAVALDGKEALKRFLQYQPLAYRVLHNGGAAAQRLNIRAYPTNIVVNRQGEVVYHTHASGPIADYWLEKAILDLKQQDP
jgi:thiol-disulfide isomerase/thioredoxin